MRPSLNPDQLEQNLFNEAESLATPPGEKAPNKPAIIGKAGD